MVAKLLALAGVWLGPEEDLYEGDVANADGFFENRHIAELNADLLAHHGGGWDVPPLLAPGWELRDDLSPFRIRAAELIRSIGTRNPWGWKDPRNTLTLPFWRLLVPNLRVVFCVRHPVEVAHSLHRRGQSTDAFGLGLWLTYNLAALDASFGERVVTHYDAYFEDPCAELRRVLDALGLAHDEETLARASDGVSQRLRHNRASTPVPEHLRACYGALCAKAGPVYHVAAARQGSPTAPADALAAALVARRESDRVAEALRAEVSRLREQLEATAKEMDGLRVDVATANAEVARLDQACRDHQAHQVAAYRQLSEREREIATTADALETERQKVAGLHAERRKLFARSEELRRIKESRGWSFLEVLWRLRLRLAPRGSRRAWFGRTVARALQPRQRPPSATSDPKRLDVPSSPVGQRPPH